MAIRMVGDLASPGTVVAVDLISQEVKPEANEWLSYGMTALGYILGGLGIGGNFAKNIGVSSLPLTARHIRDRVKAGMTGKVSSERLAFRPAAKVSRYPAPAAFKTFEDVRLE